MSDFETQVLSALSRIEILLNRDGHEKHVFMADTEPDLSALADRIVNTVRGVRTAKRHDKKILVVIGNYKRGDDAESNAFTQSLIKGDVIALCDRSGLDVDVEFEVEK